MASLLAWLGYLAVGVTAWIGAETAERRRSKNRFRSLETRVRFAESRAMSFRDQYEQVQKEKQRACEALSHERESKVSAMAGFHQAFKKGVWVAGVSCMAFGVFAGGISSGLWSTARAEARHHARLMDLKIIARVAEMNATHFAGQLDSLRVKFEELRQHLDEERVAKTVAITKLEILLEHLVIDKKSRGYALDPKRLAGKWDEKEIETVSKGSPMLPPHVKAF